MSRPETLIILVVDALGAELAGSSQFLADRLPFRKRLRTILGYSSAAIPSLLTGQWPRDHGHWCLYFRARRPSDSPFTGAGTLARLPAPLFNRWSVRRRLAGWWSRRANIRGYFGLYDVPYRELANLDYIERKDSWAAGTFPGGSFVDDLESSGIRSFVSDWRVPDDEKLEAALERERVDPAQVYLLYLTEIDARQHAHGSRGRPVMDRLTEYRPRLDALLAGAGKRGPTRLAVVSDHGMTDIHTVLDPGPVLARAALRDGPDYRVFLDSTFLRFWCERPAVVDRLVETIGNTPGLSIVTPAGQRREGIDFEDDRYGAVIALADPGVLICPSYMGRTPLAGMHGYTPDDAASDAMLLAEDPPAVPLTSILDLRGYFRSMMPLSIATRDPSGASEDS
ncbi:MAG: alkaline phosphatase family protein [Candidatus Eisenbacteria bacterium]|nr:alkaline phosphatase family protein [Candidatus Eisenbacteria bacterium]